MRVTILVSVFSSLLFWGALVSCTSKQLVSTRPVTLIDYAIRAKERGSQEALAPYAIDEEEGEMLVVRSMEEAMANYEWIVGEPIAEKTLTWITVPNRTEPNSVVGASLQRREIG